MELDTPSNVIDWLDASINVGALGVNFPHSVDASLGVLRMEWFSDQSVANFKKFLYEILSNVPEYTNLKGREARNRAPSHMEIQGALGSQEAAVARRVTMPIAELTAEEVRSLGKTEIFARLARYITERLKPRRERGQDALLDQDPTPSLIKPSSSWLYN
ncbi:hypothetical protein KC354_g15845 [Hortaea werneckii]|nr:hypothetical protein KC354_g15845 [Hortaea werneckii]